MRIEFDPYLEHLRELLLEIANGKARKDTLSRVQQALDGQEVAARFQHVCGIAVP